MEHIKSTVYLGSLKGRVLVFGGVHSNLQALKKMRQLSEEWKIPPGQVICTGDVVGYCAEPEACVKEMIDWGVYVIAGNVEIRLREKAADCGCGFPKGGRSEKFSRQWYAYLQSQLSEDSIRWMKTLPDFLRFRYGDAKAMVLHGSFEGTAEYIFRSTDWKLKKRSFQKSFSDLILGGHCGLPFHDEKDGYYWLNAGAIGMPANDGTSRVWCMVLEEPPASPFIFRHHPFEYDHARAAALMGASGLPEAHARSLSTGIWDNAEILPPEETAQQGLRIEF